MSNYSTLEHVLEEILQVVKPLQEDLQTQTHVFDELRRVIRSVESLRGDLCCFFMVLLEHCCLCCLKLIICTSKVLRSSKTSMICI
jgi:hypothetical protein